MKIFNVAFAIVLFTLLTDATASLNENENENDSSSQPTGGSAPAIPHIQSWNGENYNVHAVCDLVLLKNHDFLNGVGMDIHIRTKHIRQSSYVSSAVLRIGDDTLEVMGGADANRFWINGVAGNEDIADNTVLPNTISGYPVTFTQTGSGQREFSVNLGKDQAILFKTRNEFVRVDILSAMAGDFSGSIGLMGTFSEGVKMARDKMTVIEDLYHFEQEWQVLAMERKLFHNIEGPQHPEKCRNPSEIVTSRRLGRPFI